MARVYGVFDDFWRFWTRKNKAKQTQSMLAPSTAVGLKTKLKKQTQFSKGQNDVKLAITIVYGILMGRSG